MHPTITIDSTAARVGTYIAAAMALFTSGIIIVADGPRIALVSLPYVWLVFWVVYMLWWMPRLIVSPQEITVRNMLFSWVVPWEQYTGARLNLGLILETRDKDIRASAARPRTGVRNMKAHTGPAPLPHIDESKDALRLDLDSGQAAQLLREYYERHQEAGLGAPDRPVERRLNIVPLLVALVLLLMTFIPLMPA
ncbi:MAG TPA: PH domain-containing protein [Actinomyces sp.]|jgi:hypothetical protein|nr:PH domain-containing protein [Actinomyces sp.]